MAKYEYRTAPDPKKTDWPAGVPYIIGNEACERFSFYGMKAILQVHLTLLFAASLVISSSESPLSKNEALTEAQRVLDDPVYVASLPQSEQQRIKALTNESERHAQEVVHLFVAGVYAIPMIGAIVADRLLGKYLTIMTLSLVYCAGHAVLAVAENSLAGMYLGLGLIAVGSGGIKPCVSAHVGDQFGVGNWHLMPKVFQAFYFSINFGSFFATLLIPWLNEHFGTGVAFGVPGVLMFLATIAFWMGRHVFIHVPPHPGGKLGVLDAASSTLLFLAFLGLPMFFREMLSPTQFWSAMAGCAVAGVLLFRWRQWICQDDGFMAVMAYSVASLFNGRNAEARRQNELSDRPAGSIRRHWLFAAAAEKFGDETADGPRAVLSILSVFLLVSVFWALFDQHMSSWIRQARRMDLSFFGGTMLPSQIQSLNPLLVMLLIPFSNFVLYPAMERLGIRTTPLRRMTIGMAMASLAFVTVALIQHAVDAGPPKSVSFLWQGIPYLIMTQAEVMVSITGLEFAYTQSPKAMKSTIMGFWLLSVSFGNILVALLTRFQDLSLAEFFWLFAALMAGAALLFGAYALVYRYKDYSQGV